MNILNVLDAFLFHGCGKIFKFERVMIFQTHPDDGGNGEFFVFFFPKKRTLQYFFWQNKKNPHFPHHRRVFEKS